MNTDIPREVLLSENPTARETIAIMDAKLAAELWTSVESLIRAGQLTLEEFSVPIAKNVIAPARLLKLLRSRVAVDQTGPALRRSTLSAPANFPFQILAGDRVLSQLTVIAKLGAELSGASALLRLGTSPALSFLRILRAMVPVY